MKHNLRKSGAIAAAAFLATSCAVHQPGITPVATAPAVTAKPGSVSVPVALPALDDRGVQYAYHNSYINTVEVRLRDSLGNVFVQYVTRNVYLTDSRKAGTANVVFHNVMPGTFTLTVRTSHLRLIAATEGPIKYDSKPAAFFIDGDGDHAFDPGETEPLVISGGIAEKYVVFASDDIDPTWVFPDAMRTDTTWTQAGFGVGAATQSIVPGQTTQVAVNVGQLPRWAASMPNSVREADAGATVSLTVENTAVVAASDSIMVTSPGVTTVDSKFANGIVDLGDSRLNLYDITAVDAGAKTVSFVPTRSTNPSNAAAPGAWPIWAMRGQAAAEIGMTANGAGTNAPKITVYPALVNASQSHIFGKETHLAPGANGTVQYNLRDAYDNPVAGNVTDVNTISLATVRRLNAGVSMDYSVVDHTYTTDPRNGLNPFILPGRTAGTLVGGTYTQGGTAPGPITTAATYSVGGAGDLRIPRMEIPYFVYTQDNAAFGPAGNHIYTLKVENDPVIGGNLWASLVLTTGSTGVVNIPVASHSFTPQTKTLNLRIPGLPTGVLPVPMTPTEFFPVTITVPQGRDLSVTDDGTTFTVTSYGARRVSDTDVVRARVLNNRTATLLTGNVEYWWAQ